MFDLACVLPDGFRFAKPEALPAAARLLLRELCDNGQAIASAREIFLPHSELVCLEPAEQAMLGLPAPFPYTLRVAAHSGASDPAFALSAEYYHFYPGGERLYYQRQGACLSDQTTFWLLTAPQLSLLEALEAPLPAELSERYALIMQLQSLAPAAGAILEPYLAEEQILLPEQFDLALQWHEDRSLSVLPALPELDAASLSRRLKPGRRIRRVYAIEDAEGRSTRLVLKPEQQNALSTLEPLQRLTGEAREAFLAHPEAHLDASLFDLESFSQRVVEWGLYRPSYQAFVSKIKNEWIPGVLIDFGGGEQTQLLIPDFDVLGLLEQGLAAAEAIGALEFQWLEHVILVSAAKALISLARSQLQDKKQLCKQAIQRRVLIIRENLDALEFSVQPAVGARLAALPGLAQRPPWLHADYTLLPHQLQGFDWLRQLYHQHYSGGLLADDMGLGKTLQILSLIMYVMQQPESVGHCLIVAPLSLLENWRQEYERFFPDAPYPVFTAYGQSLQGQKISEWSAALTSRPQLVLTTYETLRQKQLGFCRINWDVVALDEAQRIKTPGTLTTNAAKALNARLKLALTGTPIENSLVDIWCILDFLAPGLMRSRRQFKQRYREEEADADIFQMGRQLRQDIGPYLLRRLKADVLNSLPPKTQKNYPADMPREQAEAYLTVVRNYQRPAAGIEKDIHIFEVLHQLRAISAHPFLLNPVRLQEPLPVLIAASARLQVCINILKAIQQAQEKVVLFAERRLIQHMLYRLLNEHFGLEPYIINGETPTQGQRGQLSRQQRIDRFQQTPGFDAIIMSPLAAGIGLNVTGANHVIHYSRHWNPAKEDQATDRVYRIGQTRPVWIHIPMASHPAFKSFDFVLDTLLARKRNLADASLVPESAQTVQPAELFAELFVATS